METSDHIWNRATEVEVAQGAREGDQALWSVLRFHGLAMNGGVLHAFEGLTATDLSRARDGFEWLGLPHVSAFMDRAADTITATDWSDDDAVDELEQSTDDEYYHLVPQDQVIEDAFRKRLSEAPAGFAPVDAQH